MLSSNILIKQVLPAKQDDKLTYQANKCLDYFRYFGHKSLGLKVPKLVMAKGCCLDTADLCFNLIKMFSSTIYKQSRLEGDLLI